MDDTTRKLAVFPSPCAAAFGPRVVKMTTEKCLADVCVRNPFAA
jgi:hypothetical protein